MSHNRHNHQRQFDQTGNHKVILTRLRHAQEKHPFHGNEVVVHHREENFGSLDEKSNWNGDSRLGTLQEHPLPVNEVSFESLVQYEQVDRLLQHENRNEGKTSDEMNKISGKAVASSVRSQSSPPTMDRKQRVGANFSRNTHRRPLLRNDSETEFGSDDASRYECNIGNVITVPSTAERRNSGSSNSSGGNKSERKSPVSQQPSHVHDRLPIPLDYNESEDDFKSGQKSFVNKPNDYIGSGDEFNMRGVKKVSYALESSESQMSHIPLKNQTSAIACRIRTDCVENDESQMDLSTENLDRRVKRSSNNGANHRGPQGSPPAPLLYRQDSQPNLSLEVAEFVEKKPSNLNNNTGHVLNTASSASLRTRYSQDSIHGLGRKALNLYAKDVLPLPKEIPENVEDEEAIRRYLSKERTSSYDSLGRRSGANGARSSMGVSSNRLIGHEASRRTASLSHAIMTLALLSASICQLRFLITYSHAHSYPVLNYFLIFTSIILEVAAGIGYVMIARCSYDDAQAEYIHNYLIFALFIVAVSNVVLAAFAFDDHICEDVQKSNGQNTQTSQNQQFNQPMMPRPDRVMDLRYMPLE